MSKSIEELATEEVYQRIRLYASKAKHNAAGYISIATGDIVQEAFTRLLNAEDLEINSETHLLALLARTVRYVLLDYFKASNRQRRKGIMVTMGAVEKNQKPEEIEFIKLHEAITRLELLDPKLARVVELKYFGSLTSEQVAEILGISETSVKRSWKFARVWLWDALNNERQLRSL